MSIKKLSSQSSARSEGEKRKMSREKKDSRGFSCKFDREIFEKLEEFCKLSGQNKTVVVERAVKKYLEENLEKMREFSKQL